MEDLLNRDVTVRFSLGRGERKELFIQFYSDKFVILDVMIWKISGGLVSLSGVGIVCLKNEATNTIAPVVFFGKRLSEV